MIISLIIFCIFQCCDVLQAAFPWIASRLGTTCPSYYKGKPGSTGEKQSKSANPCFSASLCCLFLCPILPGFGCCCSPPVLPANLLLHTQCWQQLHPLSQGFVAAFATGEQRPRGAVASRWKITPSQSFPAFSWVFFLLCSTA